VTIVFSFSDAQAEILWEGVDKTVDLEVPAGIGTTATPAVLPPTGGAPPSAGPSIPAVAVIALLAVVTFLMAATARRLR
jgi:hypothetical protein